MKGILVGILVLSAALLPACQSTSRLPDMYIEKAQLTKEEAKIADLLGADSGQLIYDFTLDETVQSVQVNMYELIDGKWVMNSGGGGQAFSDKEGRLALGFENLAEGLRIALQSEHGSGAAAYSTEGEEQTVAMSRTTSSLSHLAEITYEQELPLAVQILTSQNRVNSYDVEYFFTPGEYEKYGYEHVYAITIRFSQKTVSELDREEQNSSAGS